MFIEETKKLNLIPVQCSDPVNADIFLSSVQIQQEFG